jgi:hypothetical protein
MTMLSSPSFDPAGGSLRVCGTVRLWIDDETLDSPGAPRGPGARQTISIGSWRGPLMLRAVHVDDNDVFLGWARHARETTLALVAK